MLLTCKNDTTIPYLQGQHHIRHTGKMDVTLKMEFHQLRKVYLSMCLIYYFPIILLLYRLVTSIDLYYVYSKISLEDKDLSQMYIIVYLENGSIAQTTNIDIFNLINYKKRL